MSPSKELKEAMSVLRASRKPTHNGMSGECSKRIFNHIGKLEKKIKEQNEKLGEIIDWFRSSPGIIVSDYRPS